MCWVVNRAVMLSQVGTPPGLALSVDDPAEGGTGVAGNRDRHRQREWGRCRSAEPGVDYWSMPDNPTGGASGTTRMIRSEEFGVIAVRLLRVHIYARLTPLTCL